MAAKTCVAKWKARRRRPRCNMNSRERRAPLDPFEHLVRASLKARTAGRLPEPVLRDELIRRAARQQQHLGAGSAPALKGLFGERATPNHFVSLEALFGPRTSWFSFNQL